MCFSTDMFVSLMLACRSSALRRLLLRVVGGDSNNDASSQPWLGYEMMADSINQEEHDRAKGTLNTGNALPVSYALFRFKVSCLTLCHAHTCLQSTGGQVRLSERLSKFGLDLDLNIAFPACAHRVQTSISAVLMVCYMKRSPHHFCVSCGRTRISQTCICLIKRP